MNPKNNTKEDTLSIKEKIAICSLLYVSFCETDYEVKNSVMKYCSLNLSDRQFKKIYKSCIKFLERMEVDTSDFNLFLQTRHNPI